MSSFHEEMAIVRQRRLAREKQQAKGVLASIRSAITSGIASSVNSASSAPKPSAKVARFSSTKPAKVKAPTLGELQSAWCDLLAQEMTLSGVDRIKATSRVAKKNPLLRQQMVEAANKEREARRR